MINYLNIFFSFALIFRNAFLHLDDIRSNQGSETINSELLQNKLAEVSSDLNKIENDLSEFKPSMNELNRFLDGNTSQCKKLGGWN